MLDIDVEGREEAGEVPRDETIRAALELAFASAGIAQGHVAVHFVDEVRSHELAAAHLGKDDATDVISFPVDGLELEGVDLVESPVLELDAVERELGDIVICPSRTHDLLEAVVHGALHLCGMDHESDEGEMLVMQAEIMNWLR